MQFSLYLFNPMHNAKYALKNNLGFNLENDIRVLTNDLDVPKLFFLWQRTISKSLEIL